MNEDLRIYYLQTLGIDIWEHRKKMTGGAQMIFIGDASSYENQCGEFFTEREEQLLNAMIASIGKKRDALYIVTDLKGQSSEGMLTSYHPAYLLHNPLNKAKAFADWILVKKQLEKLS